VVNSELYQFNTHHSQLTTHKILNNKEMKNSEILELSTEELVARVSEERVNLTKLKFAHAVSTIENPTRITKVRKDIARLNTELIKRKAASASE
jgi:large subunit ribosomal protein L29